MSDLAALQGQMGSYASSFGDGQQAVSNYVSNYDSNFFNTWQDKAAKVRQQGATTASIGGGALGLQLAGKAAYKKYYGNKSGGAEGGEAGGDDAGTGGAADAGGGGAADAGEAATPGDWLGPELAPIRADVGAAPAEQGEVDDPADADDADFADALEQLKQLGPLPSSSSAAAPADAAAATDTGAAGTEAATETDAAYAASFDFGDAVGGSLVSAAGDVAAAAATATTAAVTTAASTVGTVAATAASTAGTVAATVGTVALEAVPILGAAAAIGFGLYELFSSHSPPSTPDPSKINAPVTASARAENVMPNVDGVVDAPASVTAF